MDFLIRHYSESDVLPLYALYQQMQTDLIAQLEVPASLQDCRNRLSAQERCFVATESGRIAGCLLLRRYGEGALRFIATLELFVAPSCRHRGAGRALMDACRAELPAHGYTALQIPALANAGIPADFLRSVGFAEIGALPLEQGEQSIWYWAAPPKYKKAEKRTAAKESNSRLSDK